MGLIDIQFVNDSAPYLSADNLNHMITEHNYTHNATVRNSSRIDNLTQEVDDIKNNIIPEEVVKEAVDDYVEEHSAGFATEAEVESLNESLMNLEYAENGGKNLLECVLKGTTTVNGVTITENNGTYTLNGTASEGTSIILNGNITNLYGINVKMIAIQTAKSGLTFGVSDNHVTGRVSSEEPITITLPNNGYPYAFYLHLDSGTTLNNVLIKPMITTDTSATYSDYVPYIKSVRGLTESLSSIENRFGIKIRDITQRTNNIDSLEGLDNSNVYFEIFRDSNISYGNSPFQDGFLISFRWDMSTIAHQFAIEDDLLVIKHRTCNSSNSWTDWSSIV